MALTPFFGLNYYGGSVPGDLTDDGAKFTGRDRLAIDRMLHALATSARHRYSSDSLAQPEVPTVTLGTGGGLPGGASYTYCVTFVDASGLESLPSEEVTVTTPAVLVEPDEPLLDEADTGQLPQGLYFFALTAIRGAEESPLGTQTSITTSDDNLGVTLTMPPVPAGATSFQVWRMNAQDVGWTRVAVVPAVEGGTYTDDGSVAANTNVDNPSQMPPATNLGVAIYAVNVQLSAADAAKVTSGQIAAWRVYRTETASAYPEDSLVHHVIDRDDPSDTGNPALPLVTEWDDEGDILTSGVPPLASTQMVIAPYVFDHVDVLPDAAGYPSFYPLVYQSRLYAKIGSGWTRLSDVDTGDGSGGSGGGGAGTPPIIYNQAVAATTWTISHGIEGIPAVQLYDDNYNQIDADVHVDLGVVTITCEIPTTGFARISFN